MSRLLPIVALALLAGPAAAQPRPWVDPADRPRFDEWQRLTGLRPQARAVPGAAAVHADARLSADGRALYLARRREAPEASGARFDLVHVRVDDGAATVVRDLGTARGAGVAWSGALLVPSAVEPGAGHAVHVVVGAACVPGAWDGLRLDAAAVAVVGTAGFVGVQGTDLLLCGQTGPPRRLRSVRPGATPLLGSPTWPFAVLGEPDGGPSYGLLDLSEPPRAWTWGLWADQAGTATWWCAEWGDRFAVVSRPAADPDGAGTLWAVDPERPAERRGLWHGARPRAVLPLRHGLGLVVDAPGPGGPVELHVVDSTTGARHRLMRLEGGDFRGFTAAPAGDRLAFLWLTDTSGDGAFRPAEDRSTVWTIDLR